MTTTSLPLFKALTPRQVELLLWQIVMDFGGEMGSEPAEDIPGRELLVCPGENGALDLYADEEVQDDQ